MDSAADPAARSGQAHVHVRSPEPSSTSTAAAASAAPSDLPPIRVLSIDGGGAEGLAAAKILQCALHMPRQPAPRPPLIAVHELFDVVTGTGMGSLVTCVLFGIRPDGRPLVPAAQIVSALLTSLPLVFSKKKRGPAAHPSAAPTPPRYSEGPLEGVLREAVGDLRLSDLAAFAVFPAYDLEERSPVFFSSAQALASPATHNLLLRDVTRAVAISGSLFKPARLKAPGLYEHKDASSLQFWTLQRNPAVFAHAEAARLFPGRSLLMLSIGAGTHEKSLDQRQATFLKDLGWLAPSLASALVSERTATASELLSGALGDDFVRCAPALAPGIESLDGWRLADIGQVNSFLRTVGEQLSGGELRERLDAFVARLARARRVRFAAAVDIAK
eukprot:tig00000227_g19796.t1